MMIEKELISLEGIRPAEKLQLVPTEEQGDIAYDELTVETLTEIVRVRKTVKLRSTHANDRTNISEEEDAED